MRWQKIGQVYAPSGSEGWARNTALTPTPVLLEDRIRVFVGIRDQVGVSRIGFVDVDPIDPLRVLEVATTPALDVGSPGTFDDNGVILGDILPRGESLHLYYVGFQLVAQVKFLAFTGHAISSDCGRSFQRSSDAPVLDRCHRQRYIRAIHSIMEEDGRFRVWFAAGDGWELIDGRPYPRYHIRYIESPDGTTFRGEGVPCIDVTGREYRIGRPRVFKAGGCYHMHYTRGTLDGDYIAGYARSDDGLTWTRMDDQLGIGLSEGGWDSLHLAYPAILTWRDRTYMFYNGNNMGQTGFGVALLESL
ncbi:hypothetical protein JCM30471_11790 [Desulfuromonas carbonis]|uniref:hypothetical protein n=1 Tax=Desulfuromonas sp. DDH964 TaxID=1823759 RepID=UPI00078BC6AC|nr:hypothetical protein [Desulfuromonas sp. DDH964]AMV72663.1 hypothetical protein DBW_2326 [Desulfuromonas sp. DDH964]